MANVWVRPVVHTIWRDANPAPRRFSAASAAESVFIAHSLWLVDAVWLSASGTIEVGVLYAFISYLGRLNEPLIELTTQQAMLQQAVVAGERVF